MDKNVVPKDFSLSLAIVDFIPTLFFFGSMILITQKFNSLLFLVGTLLIAFAGLAKAIWKIIVVLKDKNVWFLFIQMRTTMPIGFLLVIISLIINRSVVDFKLILNSMLSFPSIIFFILGIALMILMLIFGFMLDGSKSKNNWIEQATNIIAQACFFIGLLAI